MKCPDRHAGGQALLTPVDPAEQPPRERWRKRFRRHDEGAFPGRTRRWTPQLEQRLAVAVPSASGSPTGTGTGAACKVTNVVSAWNTGLTDSVTVTDTGATPINGWQLTFTLASGQTVTNAWNATITPASGAVTASNMSYNAAIPAGGSTSFGFQANHTGNTAPPTGFALNGVACTSS